MAAPFSRDLRHRVVAAYHAGRGTYVQIAGLFGIGPASVSRWLRLDWETQDVEPEPHGGGFPPRIAEAEYGALKALVAEKPDRTVAELCDEWRQRHGTILSRSAMQRTLRKAGFTWKKKRFRPSEQDRPDVRERRAAFVATMASVDPARLIFIDESGCNVAMALNYGRALQGERVLDSKPLRSGQNFSIVGAVRADRVLCHQTFRGPIDTERFAHFLRKRLCPRLYPGDIVVLDNLRQHHASIVRGLIEAEGAELVFLPPYSPELSPIELCWSFVKHVSASRRRVAKTE